MAEGRGGRSSYLDSIGPGDPDRKTPGHDWVLLHWLMPERLTAIAQDWYPTPPMWPVAEVEELRKRTKSYVDRRLQDVTAPLQFARCRLDEGSNVSTRFTTTTAEDQRRVVEQCERDLNQLEAWLGLGDVPHPFPTALQWMRDAQPFFDGNSAYAPRRPAIYIDRLVEFTRADSLGLSHCEDDWEGEWP